MADTKKPIIQSSEKSTADFNPVGVGIFGAIAGAALGAVAAVALSDKETRKNVQKNIKVLKDTAIKVMDTLEEVKDKPTLREKVRTVDEAFDKQDKPPTSK